MDTVRARPRHGFQLVFAQEHAPSGGDLLADDRAQEVAPLGVELGKGFVQKQQVGLHGQHGRQGQALLLAHGQGVHGARGQAVQADAGQGRHPALTGLAPPQAQVLRPEGGLLQNRGAQDLALGVLHGQPHGARCARKGPDLAAHAPGVQVPARREHEGRLAGTRRAGQFQAFPREQVEGEARTIRPAVSRPVRCEFAHREQGSIHDIPRRNSSRRRRCSGRGAAARSFPRSIRPAGCRHPRRS